MLGKLMKYELRATARTYLPLFGLLAFFTLTNSVSLSVSMHGADTRNIALIQGILMFAYVVTVMIIAAATVIITIQRFHRNLLGDEGYLMFTLPTPKGRLVLSKLLVATGWTIVAALLCLLSVFAVVSAGGGIPDLWRQLSYFLQYFEYQTGFGFGHVIWMIVLVTVVSTILSILMLYASMAVGHLANKHRVMKSIGAFMGLSLVLEFVGVSILNGFFNSSYFSRFDWPGPDLGQIWMAVGGVSLLLAVFAAGLYFGTKVILDRRLNLE